MGRLIENKKAKFNYEILEEYESGIELLGLEVKSSKRKQGSLDGAHVIIRGAEAYLVGAHIPPYQPNNTSKDYDSYRNRKLLMTKKEIHEIMGKEKMKGFTVVPISMYLKARNIKVQVAIVRGKKERDKRETIKRRESDRQIDRLLKIQ